MQSVHEDPIRYIKQRAGDKKEEVRQFIEDSREMLIHNIGIMNKKHEIIKLQEMIDDEEFKLNSAREAFKEDTTKFNSFMFECQQDNDQVDQELKSIQESKRQLD